MEKFRIDNDYEKVYKKSEAGDCYEFYCSFAGAGITRDMSENEQLDAITKSESADYPWGQ